MVKLVVAPDEAIAEMWGGVLKGAGIPFVLKKTDPLSVAYSASAASFSVELLVREEDEDLARLTLGFD
ncbi:MAG: putative signal transducing protein [Chloroflexota bacterium]